VNPLKRDKMTTIVENRQKFYVPLAKTGSLYRRNRYDILAEILATCEERSRTQSWLLTHLRLSTSSGKNCIRFLIDAKLLEDKPNGSSLTYYTTTAKGNRALRKYKNLTTKYFRPP